MSNQPILSAIRAGRDEGPAEVFNWYHDEDRGAGWRGVKVVLRGETDDERVLTTFERPPENERTMTIRDFEDMNDRAFDWADDWNAGGSRRERRVRGEGR